jgi:hypothetical protein
MDVEPTRMAGLLEHLAASEFERLRLNWERVAAQNASVEAKTVNGMGQLVASIPLYPLLRQMQRDGRTAWDADYLKTIIRDNPEVRVKTRYGTRGQELPKGTIFVPRRYAANR